MKKMPIGRYMLSFPEDTQHETYSCYDYYGVIFHVEGVKYEVLANRYMGERIYVSEGEGCWKDMPFHMGTAGFLPDCITTEKLAPIV